MSFGQAVNLFMAYKFIKNLVLPYRRWDAFRTGLIDKDGNFLVAKKDRTPTQKSSFGYFDLITLNLKKLLGKLPGGRSAIASYGAALMLVREWGKINEDNVDEYVANLEEHFEYYMTEARLLIEDGAPTMSAGAGHIAGIGVGPDGEPGLTVKQQKRHKKKKKTEEDSPRRIIGPDITSYNR